MSSPEKKKRKKKRELSPTTSNPSLPDDLLLSCLARISRLHYPTLSLVSKSFRSLLASPELYKARSLLGHTESCLYVCLWDYSDQKPRWFTLCRKPDKTLTNDTSKKKKSSGYVLARALIPHSPPVNVSGLGLVAVASSIYNIGGSRSSSSVSVLDCTSHTWSEAPSFRVKLLSLTASVVDRKIYVAGCYRDHHVFFKDSIEVLDTETQIWDPVPVSWSERKCSFYTKSACVDGKFHLKSYTSALAYNSKEGRWDLVGEGVYMSSDCYCEIENVFYSVSDGVFRWYDTEVSKWRKLKGLVGLPKFPRDVRLADYGGNMAVLWDECLPYGRPFRGYEKMIWCAEISLERRKSCGIWGKVDWFDHVLTVPAVCDLVKVLAATV